jgi:lipopolysaccharide transport system permease protein
MIEEEKWDLEIRPKPRLLEFNFKEIWRYRDLTWLFVRRDFVAQYKQTILGPFWHFIQPVLTTLMFLFIFGKVAKIPTDGIPPVLFYLSGITLWNYFAACLTGTSSTFLANASIFGKVYFPRIIMPVSVILSNIIRFGVQLLLLFIAIVWTIMNGYQIHVSLTLLLLPLLLLLMAGIGLGLGIIVSSITTKYRDVSVLMTFAVQLGMYATPIVYPSSFLEKTPYKIVGIVNPLSPIVEAFRYSLFQTGEFNFLSLGYSVLFMMVSLFIGLIMFNKVEKTFMDTV